METPFSSSAAMDHGSFRVFRERLFYQCHCGRSFKRNPRHSISRLRLIPMPWRWKACSAGNPMAEEKSSHARRRISRYAFYHLCKIKGMHLILSQELKVERIPPILSNISFWGFFIEVWEEYEYIWWQQPPRQSPRGLSVCQFHPQSDCSVCIIIYSSFISITSWYFGYFWYYSIISI